MLLIREPHPVSDLARASENRRRVCDPRGYCGPFINQDFYNAYPDELWQGIGDCVVCGSSCHVATEEGKREAAGNAMERAA